VSKTEDAYGEAVRKARQMLPALMKERQDYVRSRHMGGRLLANEILDAARYAAEQAIPSEDSQLLALASTPGVLHADIWEERFGNLRSAIVHVLGTFIMRDMEAEIEQAYEAQFGDDGPEELAELAANALECARAAAVTRNPAAGARGRYDSFESCLAAWKEGDSEAFLDLVAEGETVISDLYVEDRAAFRSAGRRFKELLDFARSRPERFSAEQGLPSPQA
jgi:hypothetical protein